MVVFLPSCSLEENQGGLFFCVLHPGLGVSDKEPAARMDDECRVCFFQRLRTKYTFMTRCGPGPNPCSSALVLPSSAGGRMVGGGPTHGGGGRQGPPF